MKISIIIPTLNNINYLKISLNSIIKNLYETKFFENVSVSISNNILEIEVEENPLIQSVSIEGIKNKNIVKIKNKELINYSIDTSLKLKKYCDKKFIIKMSNILLMKELKIINIYLKLL